MFACLYFFSFRRTFLFFIILLMSHPVYAWTQLQNKEFYFTAKFRQALVFDRSENTKMYLDNGLDLLRTSQVYSQLGVEARHRSGFGLEIDLGSQRIFYTSKFVNDVQKYFFSGTGRINYHMYSHPKQLDPYLGTGLYVVANNKDTQFSYLASAGLSHHFTNSHFSVLGELAGLINFSTRRSVHLITGLAYEF